MDSDKQINLDVDIIISFVKQRVQVSEGGVIPVSRHVNCHWTLPAATIGSCVYIVMLYFSYCTNISFYLMLKSKQVPVHNHPVIKRLLQYKNVSTVPMTKKWSSSFSMLLVISKHCVHVYQFLLVVHGN